MNTNNTTFKNVNQFKSDTHPVKNRVPTVYNHEEFGRIRTIKQGNELGFVAEDIAKALGYSDTNAMTRHLDPDESTSVKLTGMNMPYTLISEAGLYSVIIRSRVEGAKRFKRWVTHEVLPSIRKHGFYGTDDFIDNILANPNGIVAFLEKYKDDRQRRRLAEQQRDEAIEAKNKQISILEDNLRWKDENIISQKREIAYLNWQLFEPNIWIPLREITWLKDFFNMHGVCMQQIGRTLSKESRRQSRFNPRKVEHPKLGVANIYHEYVIQEFHRALINDPNFMKKFRKQ